MITFGSENVVDKPWGREIWIHLCPQYCFKQIEINKGHVTSLQYHKYKKESMGIISGKAVLHTALGQTQELNSGDFVTIDSNDIHRLEAVEDLVLFEASSPEVWDVVRLEDSYGREDK